jgi:hypothetical protein
VLVNADEAVDACDLREVLPGYLCFGEDGDQRASSLGSTVRERVARRREEIDLYIWLEAYGDSRVGVIAVSDVGRKLQEAHFGRPRGADQR